MGKQKGDDRQKLILKYCIAAELMTSLLLLIN